MNKLRIKGTLTLCSTLALLTLASTNALADPVPTGEGHQPGQRRKSCRYADCN